jgi:multiple sugar transport system permease protein
MMRRRAWWRTAAGLILTGIMLFPAYWMINVSFTSAQNMRQTPPDLFPVHGTVAGYVTVFGQQFPYLATSLGIGLGTVALTLAVAAPAGYAVAKLRPRGTGTLRFTLVIAQMIPAIIMAMGFYAIFLHFGILNTLPGLVVADSTIAVPFAVLIFSAFMAGIPKEVMEASKIDGAGPLRVFVSVVIPLSRNGILTVSLFTFLWAWSDFIFANILDASGGHQPITLGIYHYIGNNNQQWNAIMATAVVASIPAAILLVIAQRHIAAGVTAGAIKD